MAIIESTNQSAEAARRRRPRWLIVSAISVGLLLIGGVAFAYWSTSGSGAGTATTGTSSSVTVTQATAPTNLAPGTPAGAITGTITNSGTVNAYVTSVTVAIASVTKATGAVTGTCDATDYTLTGAVMAVGKDIASGGGTQAFSGATLGFNDKATIQDACKGATVNLTYTVA